MQGIENKLFAEAAKFRFCNEQRGCSQSLDVGLAKHTLVVPVCPSGGLSSSADPMLPENFFGKEINLSVGSFSARLFLREKQ